MKMTFPTAALLYTVLFALLMWPYWGQHQVIATTRQFAQLGLTDTSGAKEVEYPYLNDYSYSFIPEVTLQLESPRKSWLTLWTDKNELGRPIFHLSGLSPAYAPSWVMAQFIGNPWSFITVLSLATCYFGGLFIILYCREEAFDPLAGFLAGTSFASAPPLMYWISFPMFLGTWTWSAGILWALTRVAKRADLLAWTMLAFCCYSLLMTGYPQLVVFHSYLLCGYGFHLAYRAFRASSATGIQFLVRASTAGLVGAALTVPVFRDVAVAGEESLRVKLDFAFFEGRLPKVTDFVDAVRLVVTHVTPEIFGRPVAPKFPFPYDGQSITLLLLFFLVVSLFTTFRKFIGWWLAAAVIFLLSFSHSLYAFGVDHLGFNLSRNNPLDSLLLPFTVIVAAGVDALVKRGATTKVVRSMMIASVVCFTAIILAVSFGLTRGAPIYWRAVFLMTVMIAMLAAQGPKTRVVSLIIAQGIVVFSTSAPLLLHQSPTNIASTSPLSETIRQYTSDGSRFAIVSPGIPILFPNLNASLGLSSIHSYDSLSPMRYHGLIEALGGEVVFYDRLNLSIAPDYSSSLFWMSNIGVVLSSVPLLRDNLALLGKVSGLLLYQVKSRMGEALLVEATANSSDANKLTIDDPRLIATSVPRSLVNVADATEVELTSDAPSVLILSRKFHRDWKAFALVSGVWTPAATLEINGVFLGAKIPAGATRAQFEFLPWTRYEWVGHVFWLLMFAVVAFDIERRRRASRLCLNALAQAPVSPQS